MGFVLFLALVCAIGVAIFFGMSFVREAEAGRALKRSLAARQRELESLGQELEASEAAKAQAQQLAAGLAHYQHVRDAEDKATRLLEEAARAAVKAEERAAGVIADAEARAERLLEAAREEAGRLLQEGKDASDRERAEATRLLGAARMEAELVLARAREEAVAIAGEAWAVRDDGVRLRAVVDAMRNAIEGYGDRYLLPNARVLDELAEATSHTEAGRHLALTREASDMLVAHGQAADCDYVEAKRRTAAIHFSLSAFNGRVDAILSKVRHNNFGTLKKQIEDAWILINHNGAPFKNARVTEAYLRARLEELKWAVAASELKRLDQEEQRAIKEAMREEERARKDFERARKQAEQEESEISRELERARRELEAAHSERRAEYEARIQDLEAKWAEAEARNQRALSMAQQTKRGHVYVISNLGAFGEGVYKIGQTRRLDPLDRVRELGGASVPFGFDVHAMIYSEDAPGLEAELHRRFDERRMNLVNRRREFFRLGLLEVRHAVESMGLEVHWTLQAEAAEFRESEALRSATVAQPA